MDKPELLKILPHLVVEWYEVLSEGDENGPGTELVHYYTLHSDLSPEITQPPEDDQICVYDTITEKEVLIHLPDQQFYLGFTPAGTVPDDFDFSTLMHSDTRPDLSKYMTHITDKINSFKYRLNTVLTLSIAEWEKATVYELVDIAKNEFNYEAAALATEKDGKVRIIAELKDLFIRNTMSGHGSFAEVRVSSNSKILKSLNINPNDIGSKNEVTLSLVRDAWLNVIRVHRDKALKALDVEEETAKADEDDQGLEEIGFIKDMLRNLPEEIDYLKSLDSATDIVEFWPPILLPRPAEIELEQHVSS
tara:strand:+ start:162 stop:1079 length:918 start_codon:yes stop_codon:yes gene_type:complete